MSNTWWPPRGLAGRGRTAGVVVAVVAVAAIALLAGMLLWWSPARSTATATPGPSATAAPVPTAPPPAATAPAESLAPEPTPGVVLVPAPMTGLLVTPDAATHHPIAIMIDDHRGARPESGFNAAAVVYQAPAEGGIPRYMLVFQDKVPAAVGPVRSARQYYIEWAAEWNAMYAHAGGSPQALDTLRRLGHGQLVWNADEFRWGGRYLWRSNQRRAPHNVYTDGEHLRGLATAVGATDAPLTPAWTFGPAADGDARPLGAEIRVVYPTEVVVYHYDPISNTWPRFIDGSAEPQRDEADGAIVAPTNVVLLRMRFGPLNDGSGKSRLEAATVGSGDAWVATNGRLIHGTWSKAAETSPTVLLGPDGKPIRLTVGQTFVQVIALSYDSSVTAGRLPTLSAPRHGPAAR